jgi:hypothetical protein
VRFEFTPAMIDKLRAGAALSMGCDHPHYRLPAQIIDGEVRTSLLGDFA